MKRSPLYQALCEASEARTESIKKGRINRKRIKAIKRENVKISI